VADGVDEIQVGPVQVLSDRTPGCEVWQPIDEASTRAVD
jgi:hypothetical protein